MSFLPNLHPVFVHFSIGLLASGVAFEAASILFKRDSLAAAGEWNLFAGAIVTIGTAATGLLAAESIPHASEEAHRLMYEHRNLALVAAIIFWGAASITLWARLKKKDSNPLRPLIAGIGVVALGFLLIAGARGGELVFVHGVGVKAVPTGSHDHQHPEGEHNAHETSEGLASGTPREHAGESATGAVMPPAPPAGESPPAHEEPPPEPHNHDHAH